MLLRRAGVLVANRLDRFATYPSMPFARDIYVAFGGNSTTNFVGNIIGFAITNPLWPSHRGISVALIDRRD